MLQSFHKRTHAPTEVETSRGEATPIAAFAMPDESPYHHWEFMFNPDGHISMTRSEGKPTPFGTKKYGMWTVVASDFNEEDARAYVRMNWRDMTPYSVAKRLRQDGNPKYKDLTDAQFEALYHRMTVEEFQRAKPAFLAKEQEEKEKEQEKERQQKQGAAGTSAAGTSAAGA